jgi:quercetin dioxygenase-like cupin family protein
MTDRPAAVPTVQVDNDRVRVTEWRFPPGAATGWHRHEMDYVVVPLCAGTLRLVNADGEEVDAQLEAGQTYAREAGVEHDVINPTDTEFAFIEIELK